MLTEHTEQRQRLRAISRMTEAAATDDLELTHEASRLLVGLLEGMSREERQLSLLGWLYDYGAEQLTG